MLVCILATDLVHTLCTLTLIGSKCVYFLPQLYLSCWQIVLVLLSLRILESLLTYRWLCIEGIYLSHISAIICYKGIENLSSMNDQLIDWLTNWPSDWQLVGQSDWPADWLIDWLINWILTDWSTDPIDCPTDWPLDPPTDRLTNQLTGLWSIDWLIIW